MEWAMANASTMVGAAMPVLTDHLHHRIDKETAVTLHKKAIEQADIHHVVGMKQNQELTQAQVDQAQAHHMAEKKLTEELHRKELSEANRLHRVEMKKSHALHQAEMERSLDLHRQQIAQALKHHSHQIKVSYEAARRENLRDVWIQKGRKADTLLITVTLLFSCLVALLCEGNPPFEDEQPHEWITTLWSLLVWADFFCLTLCITLILAYTQRMADYNIYNEHETYVCGKAHRTFETFYDCHIKIMASYANSLFILGSNLLLLIGSITIASRFWLLYDNKPAAYILMVGGGVTIAVNEFFRFAYTPNTRLTPDDASDEKIMQWGSTIINDNEFFLKKNSHLPTAEDEAKKVADLIYHVPVRSTTAEMLQNETQHLGTRLPRSTSDRSDLPGRQVSGVSGQSDEETDAMSQVSGAIVERLRDIPKLAKRLIKPKEWPGRRKSRAGMWGTKMSPGLNDSAFDFAVSFEDDDDTDGQSGVNYGGQSAHSGAVSDAGSSATPHSFKSPEDKRLYMNTQGSGNHLSVNSAALMKRSPSLSKLRKQESSKSDIGTQDDQRSNGTLSESERVSMTVVV